VTTAAPSPAPSNDSNGAPTVSVTTTTGSDGVNHLVLNLSATEETWLSITSDGKQIFSGVLQPSQTKTLTTPEVAKMRVGNAGGLEVRWNGKSIGPIGPRGQVRVIVFTPENFQIFGPSQTL
jgi:cytoskeleton protein RodZ